MLYSLFMIRDNVTRINTLSSKIKDSTKEEELNTLKGKFYAMGYDLALALGEARLSIKDMLFDMKYKDLMNQITKIQTATTIEDFKEMLNEILESYGDIDYEGYNTYSFKPEFVDFNYSNKSSSQHELLNNNTLSKLFNKIKTKSDRKLNLFYPDCYDGKIISSLNQFENFNSFGNERSDYAFLESKDCFTKMIKGALKGSRIQNDAFDILYCKPYMKFCVDEDDIFASKRQEKDYINDMFKYIRKDGVMLLTIPYYRLYRDVCTMISKNLNNVRVIKASRDDFDNYGLVHIIGTKSSDKTVNEDIYGMLRRLFDYRSVEELSEIDNDFVYNIPTAPIVIDIFKGSVIDLDEIADILTASDLINKSLDSQKNGQLKDNVKNPLLPFNIGQLGLVLTSGCLDGIVDEGDGHKHLIKGRVSKQTVMLETESSKGIEVTETTVNKVEINVLLPNGEYRTLA